MGRWVWTDEMTEWVREHQDGKCSLEILPEFNEHFGLQMNSQSFRVTANRHGIRFGRGHCWKHLKKTPLKGKKVKPFTEERCRKISAAKTKFKIGETMGAQCQGMYEYVKVSDCPGEKKYMRKNRYIYEQAISAAKTKFKIGETMGAQCQGMYEYVKVSDCPGEKKYMRKNRYIYEQAYGPIPEGYSVIFLDGNPRNYSLDNLRAVPMQTLGYRRKFEKLDDPEAIKARNLMAELVYRTEKLENYSLDNLRAVPMQTLGYRRKFEKLDDPEAIKARNLMAELVYRTEKLENYSLDNLRAVPMQTLGYRRKFEKLDDPEAIKARNLMAELVYRTEKLEKEEEK